MFGSSGSSLAIELIFTGNGQAPMSGCHITDRLEFVAGRIPVNYFGVGGVLISQKNLSLLRLILG